MINKIRSGIFWWLLRVADRVTDIAFSVKIKPWQWFWVVVANSIDSMALKIASKKMRAEKAVPLPVGGEK